MAILNKIIGATLLLALSFSLHSAVLKHESTKLKIQDYSFTDFCTAMKAKDATLISVTSVDEIECFNEKFKIIDFCMQKSTMLKHVTRGYAVPKEKKIYCEEAQSVMVSISCDERDMRFCLDPKKGCEMLRKIYAFRLEIAHFAMLEKNLNCYFAKAIGESLDEI